MVDKFKAWNGGSTFMNFFSNIKNEYVASSDSGGATDAACVTNEFPHSNFIYKNFSVYHNLWCGNKTYR